MIAEVSRGLRGFAHTECVSSEGRASMADVSIGKWGRQEVGRPDYGKTALGDQLTSAVTQ